MDKHFQKASDKLFNILLTIQPVVSHLLRRARNQQCRDKGASALR